MRYLDRFHVVPQGWQDLFDFLNFDDTESKIKKYTDSVKEK